MDTLNTAVGYVLSVNQQEAWKMISHMDDHYSQVVIYNPKGFDRRRLTDSLRVIFQRHEILTFRVQHDSSSAYPFQVPVADEELRLYEPADPQADRTAAIEDAGRRLAQSYDPAADAPVKIYLAPLVTGGHILIVRLYALWADSYSCGLFCRELRDTYEEAAPSSGGEEGIEYRNFAQWQHELIGQEDSEAMGFWTSLKDTGDEWIVPFGSSGGRFMPRRQRLDMWSGDEYTGLQHYAAAVGVDVIDLLLSCYGAYLGKFSKDPVVVGYTPASRNYQELAGTLGLVMKPLPVLFDGSPATLETLATGVHARRKEVEAWSDYFQKDGYFSCAFETADLRPGDAGPRDEFVITDMYSVTTPFLIKLLCSDDGVSLSLDLYYDEGRLDEPEVATIADQLRSALRSVLEHVLPGGDLTERDRRLVDAANDTRHDFPGAATVITLFERAAAAHPAAMAVISEGRTHSYEDIDTRSSRLAHYLRKTYGLGEGDIAGILLDRNEWFIISVLAVLKTGAAFVPIDRRYPADRVAYILGDSGSKIVLSDGQTGSDSSYTTPVLDITVEDIWTGDTMVAIDDRPTPSALAYVIYTSGSTGRPKGCQISHSNLANYIQWVNNYYYDHADGNWGLMTSVSFDLTITGIFSPLTRGRKLFLFDGEMDINGLLRAAFTQPGLDTLKLTPSHLSLLRSLDIPGTDVRAVICGGEQLTTAQLQELWTIREDIDVFNEYGPTETTVGTVVTPIRKGEQRILIGRPAANTSVYILDAGDRPVAVGVTGEICIAGSQVGAGYLGQPALTAAKFTDDPFVAGGKMYRTGDTGRWLPGGELEYTGRRDDQVKVRGYRIELGEVEASLLRVDGVLAAAAVAGADTAGQHELWAFFTSQAELPALAIRDALARELPDYMIPSRLIRLADLPLTPNGKVDKKQLQALGTRETKSSADYIPPCTATEQQLSSLWQEVLGRERVGLADNFIELGGHSLKMTRLASVIHRTFDTKILLKDLFSYPVLRDQAALIDRAKKEVFVSIAPAVEAADYPLSSSQKRLWVLSQMEGGNLAYNMPAVYEIKGRLDPAALETAFRDLIVRHEILRTVFRENKEGDIRQKVLAPADSGFSLAFIDVRQEADAAARVVTLIAAEMGRTFDLAMGPLLRATLIQRSQDEWMLAYAMHHIISDGWSMGILLNELMGIYHASIKGQPHDLPPLRIQYKDYAAWQQASLNDGSMDEHRKYWLEQLSGELPVPGLPYDEARKAVKTYNGSAIHKAIRAGAYTQLQAMCKEEGATLFMGLLSLVYALLYRYTGEEDMIVGSPVAGRDHADLDAQIGFYVNTLALRARVDGDYSFRELLANVKKVMLAAYEHQLYPFDKLVDELQLKRDMSRSPLFDVMVVLQNADVYADAPDTGELQISNYHGKKTLISKFDLTINFMDAGDELHVNIEFNSDIFREATIVRMGEHLELLLAAAVADRLQPIGTLDYLTRDEKRQILEDFNDTAVNYPEGVTLHRLFEEQAARTPDARAVVAGDAVFTYEELDARASSLAVYLQRTYSIEAGVLVGIDAERNAHLLIGILGILKAGGAFLPMDPGYPKERLDYMRQDSQCRTVLHMEEIRQHSSGGGRPEPTRPAAATDLAYVIYTSGSTGTPKGVMIEHRSIVNTIRAQQSLYGAAPGEQHLQFASPSFDAAVSEIFVAVASGATLHVVPEDHRQNPALLEEYIASHTMDLATLPPAYLRLMKAGHLTALKKLVTAGEPASPRDARIFTRHGVYYNSYGPTESAIHATAYRICPGEPVGKDFVPIGTPIANTRIYIVDARRQPVPIGVHGEICIAGAGLARGYLNRTGLTAERFITASFAGGERIYLTGDVGKWLPDGNIVYSGRTDHQVKIHGYRIEPGEVEAVVKQHPAVTAATVTVFQNRGEEKELVAYVVSDDTLHAGQLRNFLALTLPYYMLPSHYIQIPSIPLNRHGKVDRQLLPLPGDADMGTGAVYEAPRNELEAELVAVWMEVLGRDNIGTGDNFFEAGGDSIRIIQLSRILRTRLGKDVSVAQLFQYPRIKDLAEHLTQGPSAAPAEAVDRDELVDDLTKFIGVED